MFVVQSWILKYLFFICKQISTRCCFLTKGPETFAIHKNISYTTVSLVHFNTKISRLKEGNTVKSFLSSLNVYCTSDSSKDRERFQSRCLFRGNRGVASQQMAGSTAKKTAVESCVSALLRIQRHQVASTTRRRE